MKLNWIKQPHSLFLMKMMNFLSNGIRFLNFVWLFAPFIVYMKNFAMFCSVVYIGVACERDRFHDKSSGRLYTLLGHVGFTFLVPCFYVK
jgi:hypothetical protein